MSEKQSDEIAAPGAASGLFKKVIEGSVEYTREDGGAALIATLRDTIPGGLFVRLQSYAEDGGPGHEEAMLIKGKVVRVTIEELPKLVIWTAAYNPFILGGDVHAPMGTAVCVGPRQALGKGFFGHEVVSPLTGARYVVESTTGAIIGSNLADVREDVETGERAVMVEQIKAAEKKLSKVRLEPPEMFWKKMAEIR